ncbi:MAG TPA: winged helix-turn-helix domain-containing protein [Nitrososphaerales archaeon]|nr:winged helix-turn-helix domain-containing protein [Nitrososphaerales archaeon]
MKKVKRSKLDIYNTMLNAIDSYGGVGRITHISYASNTPLDRTRKYLQVLVKSGLLVMQSSGDGTSYVMTPRAYDFLRAYVLVNSLLVQKE